jgi:hypothetical protein
MTTPDATPDATPEEKTVDQIDEARPLSSWEPPAGAAAAIAAHLVNASEIRRAGVSRAAVSNWFTRHPSLSALAVGEVGDGVFVYWWPQVARELRALGLPNPAQRGYRPRSSESQTEETGA